MGTIPENTKLPVSACDSSTTLLGAGALQAPLRPGVAATLDRFEVIREIGEGGMGVVLLARDTQSGAEVAIKMLRRRLADNARAVHRFGREARHMKGLDHPHILKILEVASEAPQPYFVMPYMPQGSLARRIQPGKPLDYAFTLSVARQLAEALHYAHSKGLIHRDLKPANILLDARGHALLADFGLARTFENDSMLNLESQQREGTAPYMSPAVAAGLAEDTRCDIYSFGALLYEMLTGCLPYEGETTQEIMNRICAGPPRPIGAINPAAPKGLMAIAQRAMARRHRDRYAAMEDVLSDLVRVERGLAPRRGLSLSRPVWAGQRLAGAAGAAVVLTALVIGLMARPNLETIRTLEATGVLHWAGAALGEWNGDGEADLFLAQESKRLLVLSSRGEVLTAFSPPSLGPSGGMTLPLVRDLNRDPLQLDEAWLAWAEGSNVTLRVINQNVFEIGRFDVAGATYTNGLSKRIEHTTIEGVETEDLDGDGSAECLVLATTGHGLKPRALYCFRANDATLLWRQPLAPWPRSLRTADLDGDGRREVIVGSDAVANGNKLEDGTDDARCYLYVFSHQGSLRWRREVAGIHTIVHPVVVPLKNTREAALFASVEGNPDNREPVGEREVGRILRFDAGGKIVAAYDTEVQVKSCAPHDLDNDGQGEVLATDRNGFLHVLDLNLSLKRRLPVVAKQFDAVELNIVAVTNLTAGARKQVVLSSSELKRGPGRNTGNDWETINVLHFYDYKIIVLDADLDFVAEHRLAEQGTTLPNIPVLAANMDEDAAMELVALSERVKVLKLRTWW